MTPLPPSSAGRPRPAWHARLRRPARRCSGGFTVVELIMTLAIAAVLLAVAAPSVEEIIRRNRLNSRVDSLILSLNLARSEAVKRAVPVTVCKSSTGTGCQTSGVNWENGWIVFSDIDQDQTYDAGDGEVIVQINAAIAGGYTLRTSADLANSVTFIANGSSPTQGTMVLCANNRIDHARSVGVSLAGRIRAGADTDEDGIPEALNGAEITSCTSP